jgi:hypothetical protein
MNGLCSSKGNSCNLTSVHSGTGRDFILLRRVGQDGGKVGNDSWASGGQCVEVVSRYVIAA